MEMSSRRFKSRGYPNTLARLLFFWAKASSPSFRFLSQTVIRVISSYIFLPSKFLALVGHDVYSLDPVSVVWNKELTLDAGYGIHRALHLSGNTYFLDVYFYKGFESFLLVDGHVSTFALSQRRHYCLAYDSAQDRVLRFGGILASGSCTDKVERSADAGSLSRLAWRALSEMQSSRAFVWPCWHQGLLYLCGGFTTAVETFDPVSDSFESLYELFLPDTMPGLVMSRGGQLVLFFYREVTVWDSDERTVKQRYKFNREVFFTEYAPVVYEGQLYKYEKRRRQEYCKLDLITGKETCGRIDLQDA